MSRRYEFDFVESATGLDLVTVRAFGNTRRSAERIARRKLVRDHKKDQRRYYTDKVRFVPEGK